MDELDELSALFDMEDDDVDPFLPVADETSKKADEEDEVEEHHETDLEAELAKLQEQMAKVKQQMESKKKKAAGQRKTTTTKAAVGLPLIPDSQPESSSSKSFADMFATQFDVNETSAGSSFNQEKVKPAKGRLSAGEELGFTKKRRTGCTDDEVKRKLSKTSTSQGPADKFFQSKSPATSGVVTNKVDIETFSRIRLRTRCLDATELKQRMEGKLFIKTTMIQNYRKSVREKDWVTIGVVVKKLNPQTSKNGKSFSIMHISDLDDCTKHVSLFLFGVVHSQSFRNLMVGDVIGLLNPSIMPPKNDQASSGSNQDGPALTIDVSERLLKIGTSIDLGWCRATKYLNRKPVGKCQSFVNKQYGETCIFHMQKTYNKTGAKRNELQGAAQAPVAAKYKKTMWNKVKNEQFFYGGQLFSAKAPGANSKVTKQKESQMKLTSVFSNLHSQATPTKTIDEKYLSEEKRAALKRSKVMQTMAGLKSGETVTGCSDAFAEMLGSGDNMAGSRQFLTHLRKKQEAEAKKKEKESTTPTTPTELLKQMREKRAKKNQSPKIPTSASKPSSSSSLESKIGSKRLSNTPKIPPPPPQVQKPTTSSSTTKNKQNMKPPPPNGAVDLNKIAEEVARMKRERALKRQQLKQSQQQTAIPSKKNVEPPLHKVASPHVKKVATKPSEPCCSKQMKFITPENFKKSTREAINNMMKKRSEQQTTTTTNNKTFKQSSPQLSYDTNDKFIHFNNFDTPQRDTGFKTAFSTSFATPSKPMTPAEYRKMRAIAKLKNGKVSLEKKDPKSEEKLRQRIKDKVEEDQRLLQETSLKTADRNSPKKKNLIDNNETKMAPTAVESALSVLMSDGTMSKEEFEKILNASSSHNDALDVAEIERQEKYFNPRIKKEMMEQKMDETKELSTKVVSCKQCDYTFWGPHERCKMLKHTLTWTSATKRFWSCQKCQQRTTTWTPYPTKACWGCGSEKMWVRCSMLRPKKHIPQENEILLVRGIEHSRFLNSLR